MPTMRSAGIPPSGSRRWQQGQLEVSFTPQDQVDVTWISDNLFVFYGNEGVPFIGNAITDPVRPGWLWTGREHVFRSTQLRSQPRVPASQGPRALQRVDGRRRHRRERHLRARDRPLRRFPAAGQPRRPRTSDADRLRHRPRGRPRRGGGARPGATPRRCGRPPAPAASSSRRTPTPTIRRPCSSSGWTPWRTTTRRDTPRRSSSTRATPTTRGSPSAASTPRRPRPRDTSSRSASCPPAAPWRPRPASSSLDGHKINGYGDIPASSIIVSSSGTIYVGNDFGVVQKQKNSPVWHLDGGRAAQRDGGRPGLRARARRTLRGDARAGRVAAQGAVARLFGARHTAASEDEGGRDPCPALLIFRHRGTTCYSDVSCASWSPWPCATCCATSGARS